MEARITVARLVGYRPVALDNLNVTFLFEQGVAFVGGVVLVSSLTGAEKAKIDQAKNQDMRISTSVAKPWRGASIQNSASDKIDPK